jgi:hypothetical protein
LQKFKETSGRRRLASRGEAWPKHDESTLFLRLLEDCFITGHPCLLVRRALYQSVGPFREDLVRSQDHEMLLRLARQGRGAAVDEVVLWQRQHDAPRGSLRDAHGVKDRNANWIHYDQIIFRQLLPTLSVDELTPTWTGDESGRSRAASFQMFALAGRKKLWREALGALARAGDVEPGAGLRDVEQRAVEIALGSRYGVGELFDDAMIVERLCDATERLAAKGRARTMLIRPLLYRLRDALRRGEVRESAQLIKLMVRLAGPSGVAAALVESLNRRIAPVLAQAHR